MTTINFPIHDGSTIHNNFYTLPEGMAAETGLRICAMFASRWEDAGEAISWAHFDDALAKWGILPLTYKI